MEYWIEAPAGAVTTIVPFGATQVGCTVIPAVGAAGLAGIVLTVRVLTAEIQPVAVFLAVTE